MSDLFEGDEPEVIELRGDNIHLSFYGAGAVKTLKLRPTSPIAVAIGAQLTFEVVGIERRILEGEA